MSAWFISVLVFVILVGGALSGVVLRPLLSKEHLHPDSRDVVKMATGLIGTRAALVLGLLIASAKDSFDLKTNQVRQVISTVILMDDLLAQYGPEATRLRILLRQGFDPLADSIWREEAVRTGKPVHFESSVQSLALENELEHLAPNDFPGLGAEQPLYGPDGSFERGATKRTFTVELDYGSSVSLRPMQAGTPCHFVTRCRVGVASVGAAGEIENVSHVFQPDGRLAASNSPYALKFR